MRRELRLQKRIVQYINLRGGRCQIRAQTPYTTVGDPDITGCYRGRHIEIEVKVEGENPTAVQEKRMDWWEEADAVVFVARSVKDVAHYFDYEWE